MELLINGQKRAVRDGLTLEELVSELSIEGRPIAVELNFAVVPKDRYASTRLSEGDRLEIVSLVGGG